MIVIGTTKNFLYGINPGIIVGRGPVADALARVMALAATSEADFQKLRTSPPKTRRMEQWAPASRRQERDPDCSLCRRPKCRRYRTRRVHGGNVGNLHDLPEQTDGPNLD